MSVIIQGDEVRAITQGILVERATATLPQTTGAAIFTVSVGRVLILGLLGEVTTVIQTQANATKLVSNPTATGTSQDLCATLDISADAVGEMYTISGTVGDAMRSDLLIGNPILQNALVVSAGTIELNCAASNTGSVKWSLLYVPLDDGASVAAA
jgi:hypothetical protein